jgi:hypothetical protein
MYLVNLDDDLGHRSIWAQRMPMATQILKEVCKTIFNDTLNSQILILMYLNGKKKVESFYGSFCSINF